MGPLLTAVVIVVGTLGAVSGLSMLSRRHRKTLRHAPAADLYGQLLAVLARYGIEKPPSSAALEFARHIRQRWPEAEDIVQRLTRLYCQTRFGGRPVKGAELEQAHLLLATLRRLGEPALDATDPATAKA